jgi:hypothetical protein
MKSAIVFMIQTVALFIFTLVFPFKGIARPGTETTARHPAKAQMRHQLHGQVLCTGGNSSSSPRKSVKNPGRISSSRQ